MRNQTRELLTLTEQQEVLKILADSFEQKFGSLFPQKDSLKKLTDFPEAIRPYINRYRRIIVDITKSSYGDDGMFEQFDEDPKTIPCPKTMDEPIWRPFLIADRKNWDLSFNLFVSLEFAFSEMAKNSQTDLSMIEPEFRQRMLRFKRTLQDLSKKSAAQLIKGFNNLPADHPERHVFLNFFADSFLYLFRKQHTIGCTVGMSLGIVLFGELEHYPGNRPLLAWNDYLPLIQDLFLEHYSWDKFTKEDAARNINEIFWMMNAMSAAEIEWLRAYFSPIHSADITAKQLGKAATLFRNFFEIVLRIKKINPTFELPKPPSFIISFQINSDYLKRITTFMEKNCSNPELPMLLIDEIPVRNSGSMLAELLDLAKAPLVSRKDPHEFEASELELLRNMVVRLPEASLQRFKADLIEKSKESFAARRNFLFFQSALFKLNWITDYPGDIQSDPVIAFWSKQLVDTWLLAIRFPLTDYMQRHFSMLQGQPIEKVRYTGLLLIITVFLTNFDDPERWLETSVLKWIENYFLKVDLNKLPIEQIESTARCFLELWKTIQTHSRNRWAYTCSIPSPASDSITIVSDPDYLQRISFVMQKTTCFLRQRCWLDNLPSMSELQKYADEKFSKVITQDDSEPALRKQIIDEFKKRKLSPWYMHESEHVSDAERYFFRILQLGSSSVRQFLLGFEKTKTLPNADKLLEPLVSMWPYRFNQPFAHFDKPSIADYENNKDLALEWRNIIINMPKNPKQDVVKLLNDYVLSQYSWDKLNDTYFLALQMILYVASPALTNWFKAYFKPLDNIDIDANTLLNATKQFVNFSKLVIKQKIDKLPEPPVAPIGFSYSSDYLLRITTLMEKSRNPDLQMSCIDDVPTLEMINEAHHIRFFNVLVKEQFLNNHLPSWVASHIGAPAAMQKEKLLSIQAQPDLNTFIAEVLCWISLYKPGHLLQVRSFFKLLQTEFELDDLEESEKQNIRKIIANVIPICFLSSNTQSLQLLPAWLALSARLSKEYGVGVVEKIVALRVVESENALATFVKIAELLLDLTDYFNAQLRQRKQAQPAAEKAGKAENQYRSPGQIFSKHKTFSAVIACLQTVQTQYWANKFPEKSYEQLRLDFLTVSDTVKSPLSQTEFDILIHQCEQIDTLGKNYFGMSPVQLGAIAKTISTDNTVESTACLLAIIRECIRQQFGIFPYRTQMLAVLGMIHYPAGSKGRLAQIKTGEGKSTVSTILATYFACKGRFVDIITSNHSLATRDQEKYSDFYKIFGITCSHICKQDPSQTDFEGQVLLGTNTDFEFSILRESLLRRQNRYTTVNGKKVARHCDIAIVDEADSLFFERQSARIANDAAADVSWVYKPILNVLETKGEMAFLLLSSEELRLILSRYQQGRYAKQVATFTETQLLDWKENAILAQKKIEGDRYVIKNGSRENPDDKSKRHIVIMNKNTGHLSHGCQWNGGLHQFVEMKHGIPPSAEDNTIAAISHPVFFGMYRGLFGLTGTVGESIERNEIRDIYHVDIFDVPTHAPILREKKPATLTQTIDEQSDKIILSAQTHRTQGRPVLVLFNSINQTEAFARKLSAAKIPCLVLNEQQKEDEHFIIARAGNAGAVTVATNMAGRGTDIILSSDAKLAGGLHVIFAFYPEDLRIEEQGFGRAGRQGQKGSGEMILSLQDPMIQRLVARNRDSLPKILQSLINGQFISVIQKLRSDSILEESTFRKKSAEQEKLLSLKLQLFFSHLISIRDALLLIDKKQLATVMTGGCDAKAVDHFLILPNQPILTAAVKHIYDAAHQPLSDSMITYLRTAYFELLLDRWARWFTEVSHHRFSKNSIEEYTQALNRSFEQLSREGYLAVTERPLESFYAWVSQLSSREFRHDGVRIDRTSGSPVLFTTPAQSASNDACASSATLNNGFD